MAATTSICWVVNNVTHYHRVRMQALASSPGLRSSILELSDKDAFAALRTDRQTPELYARATLFPSRTIQGITSGMLRSALWEALDRMRPEVLCVNGWGLPGSRATLKWCLSRKVPAVVMSDSTATDFRRVPWKEWTKTRLLRHFSAALVAGARHREYLVSLGFPTERVFTGYDVVDNEHFANGAEIARVESPQWRQRLELPEKYFLAVSRFSPKKNNLGLIQAYGAFRRNNPRSAWKLVLVGDGELRQSAQDLSSRLGLGDDVLFAGEQRYDALPAYYALASAFVHASTSEQWGLVVNEAMAAGLPVLISSACGCVPDLVRESANGFAFSPADPTELAGLLSRVASPDFPLLEFGRSSREIIARWTPSHFAQGMAQAARVALDSPRRSHSALDQLLFANC